MNEPRVGATIPGRIDSFFAPLQKSLRVSECPFLFSVTGSREKENFGIDVLGLQLPALNLGRFAPEICRFNFDHLAHHQPFQFRKRFTLEPRIRSTDGWIL